MLVSIAHTSTIQAQTVPDTIKKPAIILGSLILGGGVYRLFQKRSVKNPATNFNKGTLKTALKEKNWKQVITQILDFLDDYYVGQSYKSSSIKVDSDGKSFHVHPGCPPSGLLGRAHSYLYPLAKALMIMFSTKKFLDNTRDGIQAFKTFSIEDLKIWKPKSDESK